MADSQRFSTFREDNVTVVELVDPRRFGRFGRLDQELRDYFDVHPCDWVVFDFTHVSYCPSDLIGDLLAFWKREGSKLKACSMNPMIRQSLGSMMLDQYAIDIYDSREKAIASFQSPDQ